MLQPLWKSVWQFHIKESLHLPYDLAISLPGIYFREIKTYIPIKNLCAKIYSSSILLSHFSRAQLCDPIDGSPPGSAVPGILQARTLEWVAISFSNAWKWKVKVKSLRCVRLFGTPWTAAYQAPPSMGFSRQEYWSGLPLPSPSSSIIAPKLETKYPSRDK